MGGNGGADFFLMESFVKAVAAKARPTTSSHTLGDQLLSLVFPSISGRSVGRSIYSQDIDKVVPTVVNSALSSTTANATAAGGVMSAGAAKNEANANGNSFSNPLLALVTELFSSSSSSSQNATRTTVAYEQTKEGNTGEYGNNACSNMDSPLKNRSAVADAHSDQFDGFTTLSRTKIINSSPRKKSVNITVIGVDAQALADLGTIETDADDALQTHTLLYRIEEARKQCTAVQI